MILPYHQILLLYHLKLILVFRSNAELSYIRIHIVNRIVVAEGIRRDAAVLLREGILCEPAAENWVVLAGTVVDVGGCIPQGCRIERRLLLLAVVAEPVGFVCQACGRVPAASERVVVVGLNHFSRNSVNNCPDASKMVGHMKHRNHFQVSTSDIPRHKPTPSKASTLQLNGVSSLPVYQRAQVQKTVPITAQRADLRTVCKIGIITETSKSRWMFTHRLNYRSIPGFKENYQSFSKGLRFLGSLMIFSRPLYSLASLVNLDD